MCKNIPKQNLASNVFDTPTKAKFHEALLLHQQGKLLKAQALYEDILKLQPRHFDSLHLLGVIACQTNNLPKGLELIGQAIALNPENPVFYSNQGNTFQALMQFESAIASYNQAITLNPDYAEAYNNRGSAFQKIKQFDNAIENYNRTISLKPDYADAYYNRGSALQELKRFAEAVRSYDRAIALNPDFTDAYYNRGNALKELKLLEDAVKSYDQAIALNPDHAEAYLNKSLTFLLGGDYDNGWALYEWRWKQEKSPSIQKRNFTQPLWIGKESLIDKTIVLHSEQGFGDTIQFCRYSKSVAELGARVIMEVEQPLVRLLQDLPGVSDVLAKGSSIPPFDYHCPLLTLPLVFRTNIQSIPYAEKYLRSNTSKRSYWASKLGDIKKPLVGLVWSGSPMNKNDNNRSIFLAELIQNLPSYCQYISLQKEVKDIDKKTLERNSSIRHFGDELNDFADTAALCELMDIVISVDTAIAHLSGALGKETWVLLPFSPDWRWLLDRNDSPWYRSVKLYRQPAIGDWDSVLSDVSDELAKINDSQTSLNK